jgi:Fn3 associated/Chitobiase/beta-hexosaminidase C-terminal domain
MNRILFIFLMWCLFVGACSINTALSIPIDSININNNTGPKQPSSSSSSIKNPILGPEYGYFANGFLIAGEVKVTVEVPNYDSYDELTIVSTFDGTEPTRTNGEIYTDPISFLCDAGDSFTVKAFAFTDKLESNVSTKKYTCADVKLKRPRILPVQQYYERNDLIEVAITDPDSKYIANIKTIYTTDGSAPTASNGTLYDGLFEITGSPGTVIVIKAIALLDDGTPELPVSPIAQQEFIFPANQ